METINKRDFKNVGSDNPLFLLKKAKFLDILQEKPEDVLDDFVFYCQEIIKQQLKEEFDCKRIDCAGDKFVAYINDNKKGKGILTQTIDYSLYAVIDFVNKRNQHKKQKNTKRTHNWTKIGVIVAIIVGIFTILGVIVSIIIYWDNILKFFGW